MDTEDFVGCFGVVLFIGFMLVFIVFATTYVEDEEAAPMSRAETLDSSSALTAEAEEIAERPEVKEERPAIEQFLSTDKLVADLGNDGQKWDAGFVASSDVAVDLRGECWVSPVAVLYSSELDTKHPVLIALWSGCKKHLYISVPHLKTMGEQRLRRVAKTPDGWLEATFLTIEKLLKIREGALSGN